MPDVVEEPWDAPQRRNPDEPAPAPDAEPFPDPLRNFGLETVDECAKRMLLEISREPRHGLSSREAARMTAESCARSWRLVGNRNMSEFYNRVGALLSDG